MESSNISDVNVQRSFGKFIEINLPVGERGNNILIWSNFSKGGIWNKSTLLQIHQANYLTWICSLDITSSDIS